MKKWTVKELERIEKAADRMFSKGESMRAVARKMATKTRSEESVRHKLRGMYVAA